MSTEEAAEAVYEFAMQIEKPATDKLVETIIGVITVAYPLAGIILNCAWDLVISERTSEELVRE